MALMTPPSGDQLTAIRSDNHYRALQFVCLVPNTVVVQFQPDAGPADAVYAEITVGAIEDGDMADVREGMVVVYSTTTDLRASEVFRTRVRKVSGATTLYVAENSQTLTTSHYVTVLNTYQVMERLRRSETLVDWEITFRKLLPIETALQTAYVLTNDVVEWSETAVPKAMDASASSSFTHAWESSNPNDTLDSGGTTATPTFTLEAGAHRWLRHTFTDSNGNANYRVISVHTVPKDYSACIATGIGSSDGGIADVSYDAELGWSATIPAFAGIDTVLDKTFCVIACDEWYDDERASIRTNINMCGYLQTENTNTAGDAAVGRTSETRFTIEGFGQQLARQNISAITVFRTTGTPATWDTIQNPTPGRMLTYRITEYSTVSNLCALSLPPDDTDFIGDDLDLTSGKALDDIRTIAEGLNAELQFDVNGKLDLCRNLNVLDDTARDAADVIITFQPADLLSISYDYDYSKTCSMLTVTGGAFNTATGEYDVFEAIAPAVARETEGDPLAVPNQVLTTDNTPQESLDESAERAENLFALNNPTYLMNGSLKAEFHWLVVDIGSWVKFNIAGTDTVRGKVFGSSDRWQLISLSKRWNNLTGVPEVEFTARHETSSTGAMVRASQIVEDGSVTETYYPGTTAPFSGVPTGDGVWFDSDDTSAPNNPNPPDDPDCELGGFRVKSILGYSTTRTALNGEQISILARGAGQIGEAVAYDFTSGQNSFTIDYGSLGAGIGIEDAVHIDVFTNAHRGLSVTRTGLSLGATEKIVLTFDYVKGAPEIPTASESYIVLNGVTVAARDYNAFPTSGADLTWEVDGLGIGNLNSIVVQINCDIDVGNDRVGGTTGSVTLKSIQINDQVIYGDFCYYWTGTLDEATAPTPYSSGQGGLIELAQPASIPPFSTTHEYSFLEIVTSGPVQLTFESPYSIGQASNWSVQAIICFQGVP
jgi:hypothetical protein